MNKEFILYEQALALKELGFGEPCLARHIIMTEWEKPTGQIILQMVDCLNSDKNLVKAPLYQQVFRWFREKYNLVGLIEGGYDNGNNLFTYVIWQGSFDNCIGTYWKTYEEAELACINKLIEIVKDGTKINT
jgi:hypothetical protein